MNKRLRWLAYPLLLLLVLYVLGPRPARFRRQDPLPAAMALPANLRSLENSLQTSEAAKRLKPGAAARIVWADSVRPARTKYAFLYLHGFTATHMEGHPVHTRLAARFQSNLFLARLAEHGLSSSDPLQHLTARNYWESAVQALRLAEQLGDSIILISTSTGGTLANMLCADERTRRRIAANILYSPNIAIRDPAAFLLNNPWGLQIARMVMKSHYIHSADQRPEFRKHWYSRYRIEGAVAVEELIEREMKVKTFRQIQTPTLLLYYYQNEEAQDPVVKVSAMRDMYRALGTPDRQKEQWALAGPGDHVLTNPLKSRDIATVYARTEAFLQKHLFAGRSSRR